MDEFNSDSERPDREPPADNPLEHIVDETEAIGDCRDWVYRQFVAGRDADSLLAELIANGWAVDDAEGMVEEGRRATRRLRGVITRNEVAHIAEMRYRNAFRLAFRMALGGLPLIIVHFLLSFTSMNKFPWPARFRSRGKSTDNEKGSAAVGANDETKA